MSLRLGAIVPVAVWLASAGLGCEGTPLTQVVVVIDSDSDGFDRVEVDIAGFEREATVRAGAREGAPLLPRRFALVHDGGPLGPIALTVRAYVAGERDPLLVEPRTDVRFVREQTRMLKIDLRYECIGRCEAGEACLEGPRCVASDDPRANRLSAWTGRVDELEVTHRVRDGHVMPVQDAGTLSMPDASGADAAPDGGRDSRPVQPLGDYPYAPSNFDPSAAPIRTAEREDVVLDCGVSEFDSSTLAFSNFCGHEPAAMVIEQPGSGDAALLLMDTLTIAAGSELRLSGQRPVILAVFGDARIAGTVDASARGATPGPGADRGCEDGHGSPGADAEGGAGGGGGGGGAFGSPGGPGGLGGEAAASAVAPGGVLAGDAALTPLRGGCSGGSGGAGEGEQGGAGGGGGGALQISAAGRLDVLGVVLAAGGGGRIGGAVQDGGGGGGSGGAILLEGAPIDIDSAAVIAANGGGGGGGQSSSGTGQGSDGEGGLAGPEQAQGGAGAGFGGEGGQGAAEQGEAAAGEAGDSLFGSGAGGGGGGGGAGRIRVNGAEGCTVRGVFSPSPSVGCASCGACPGHPGFGCTPHPREGRVYYMCEALDWNAARARCEAAELALVRIDDEAENEFVAMVIAETSWIGASDATSEGEWSWSDGTAFWSGEADGAAVDGRYSAWAPDQPDNQIVTQVEADCGVIAASGSWYDRDCASEHPFVCEPE